MRAIVLVILAGAILSFCYSAYACESGHWISAVMADGEIIKLEDDSLWEVSSLDRIDSRLWLPMSNLVICDDKLINTDDNETVEATQIH